MPRKIKKLPEKYVEEYKINRNLSLLAAKSNVSTVTAKARLRELGIIHSGQKKIKWHTRILSKELLEKRKINTLANNKYLRKTNVKVKKWQPTVLKSVGYCKI